MGNLVQMLRETYPHVHDQLVLSSIEQFKIELNMPDSLRKRVYALALQISKAMQDIITLRQQFLLQQQRSAKMMNEFKVKRTKFAAVLRLEPINDSDKKQQELIKQQLDELVKQMENLVKLMAKRAQAIEALEKQLADLADQYANAVKQQAHAWDNYQANYQTNLLTFIAIPKHKQAVSIVSTLAGVPLPTMIQNMPKRGKLAVAQDEYLKEMQGVEKYNAAMAIQELGLQSFVMQDQMLLVTTYRSYSNRSIREANQDLAFLNEFFNNRTREAKTLSNTTMLTLQPYKSKIENVLQTITKLQDQQTTSNQDLQRLTRQLQGFVSLVDSYQSSINYRERGQTAVGSNVNNKGFSPKK